MEFEWDDQKAATNLRKHGIDFEDAMGSSLALCSSSVRIVTTKKGG